MHYTDHSEVLLFADSLQRSGYSNDEILQQLQQKGTPENLLTVIIENLKSIRLSRKRKIGFACCSIGLALLVIGCMLTLFLISSGGNIKFVMYGLTTIGVVLTLKGMIDLLGW
ncbi:MAG: hypothetical protein IPH18_00100 [Chitinophagaceae bacterium]|nr:hypothetical protein [Chitinophagaceae bacterium]MBK8951570.1 hypothetical protein [Chitinophagaceae bacterium]